MVPTEANEARLTLIDPDHASKAVSDAFKLLPVINLFRAMANAESLYPAYISYVNLLFKPVELDSKLERMIVLHVGCRSDCYYVWRQNVVVAKSLGVTQAQIDALELGETNEPCFSDDQQVAFRFTDEAMQLLEVTDQTYADTKRCFSDRAITEMLYVIGTYMFLSRLARTGRVPLDEHPADAPKP